VLQCVTERDANYRTCAFVAVCCSVLQRVAVRCSALQREMHIVGHALLLQCVAVCCSVSQCVAVCRSVSQRVALCCSVLQRETHVVGHELCRASQRGLAACSRPAS